MADMGRRQPSADEPLHTLPLDTSLLAPPFERVMPEVTDREAEVSQSVPVARHSEVPDSGPARCAAHPEMAERGRAGKGSANVRGGRLATGRKCIAAAGEYLPPLRLRSLGPGMA